MQKLDTALFAPYGAELLSAELLSRYAFSLCGGPCRGMFRVTSAEMLKTLAERCFSAGIPCKVFGGMTNVLVSDEGFDGVVLLNRNGTVSHTETGQGDVLLKADSGAAMAAVVRYCADHEISGMEWAAGLPGTVGGAVYGNAGAYGSDIAENCLTVTVFDPESGVCSLSDVDMGFAYRSSLLKLKPGRQVILDAVFRLGKGRKDEIIARAEECRAARKMSQPVDEHSLGSVFRNPPGESAGRLIQAAGLKGFSIGKASVSSKHANFIVTETGVTAADYRRLVLHVQKTVRGQFGVLLEPEIEMLGFEAK